MTRSVEMLVKPQPFLNVLDGEFTPFCDPLNRSHTLEGLAIATFEKGFSGEPEANAGNISYRPSWVRGVACQIGRTLLPSGESRLIEVSLLSYNDEDEISFIDLDDKQLLVYEANRQSGRFEFIYDYQDNLDDLRVMAAQRAKLFLDTISV